MTEQAWQRRARSFGAAARDYQRGRPGYPLDAVRWCLPDAAGRVLDLAAGTGKLTEGLLALDLDVVAVEPLDEMRALIPSAARSIAGTAEDIPLDDAYVDAVLVGQAFHWFRAAEAVAEIVRVLRPGGTIGMLWNYYDDTVPWVAEVAEAMRSEARASRFEREIPPYADVPELTPAEGRRFRHSREHDLQSLLADVSSTSAIIVMSPEERAQVLAQVRSAAPAGTFTLPYVCQAWRGVRR